MDLATQLRRDEGCRLTPYQDSLGFWTVGVGHKMAAGDSHGPISQAYADQLLTQDIGHAIAGLYDALPWVKQLDSARQGCLLNMAFNMGLNGLLAFHQTLASIHAGDFATAATEMANSTWYHQVGQRAVRLCKQMELGIWQ